MSELTESEFQTLKKEFIDLVTTAGLLPPDETIELPFPFDDTEYTVPILQEWMNYIFSQQLARWDNARACNHVDHKKYKDTILDIGSEFAEKAENDDFDVIYLALATLLTNYNLFPIDNQGLRRKIGLAASRSIQAYVNSVSAREKGDFRYEKDHLFFDINNLPKGGNWPKPDRTGATAYSAYGTTPQKQSKQAQHPPQHSEPKSLTFTEAFNEYAEFKIQREKWSLITKEHVWGKLSPLYEYYGDFTISEFSRDHAKMFFEILNTIPIYRNTRPQYKKFTIHQLMKRKHDDHYSVSSINDSLSYLAGFTGWLNAEGYIEPIVVNDLKINEDRTRRQKRPPFTQQDLLTIFTAPRYVRDTCRNSALFWLPIIGLYTGARLEEIAQLRLNDISEIDGIWCLNVTDLEKGQTKPKKKSERAPEDKKIKNASSRRIVPIHPFLLDDLNLLKLVEKRKKDKVIHLFPNLRPNKKGKRGISVSKSFGKFKKKLPLSSENCTFHSFRHTVINFFKQNTLEDKICKEVTAHSSSDKSAYSDYGDDYNVKIKYEKVILKLDFEIDLSHLKKSKYVIKSPPYFLQLPF